MTIEVFIANNRLGEDVKELMLSSGLRDEFDEFEAVSLLIKKDKMSELENVLTNGYPIDSQEKGDFGSSLLQISIRYDKEEIFNMLIKKGANINMQDLVGWTPLMEAVINQSDKYTKLLVDAGCDKEVTNKRGLNALQMASKFQYQSIVELLK